MANFMGVGHHVLPLKTVFNDSAGEVLTFIASC